MVAGLAIACCGEQDAPALRVVVTSNVTVPDAMDEVVITLTASRTPEGNFCVPSERNFSLRGPADLPIEVVVLAGEQYSEWVAIRAVGLSGGEEVMRRQSRQTWPVFGEREIEIVLDSSCLGLSCSEEEQCVPQGRCAGVPDVGIFEDAGRHDLDAPCSG